MPNCNDRPIHHCETMKDVRKHIDTIDRELIALLAERQGYVRQAGRIKNRKDLVRDEARIQDVLNKVCRQAEQSGLNAKIARTIWMTMINAFIDFEHDVWNADHPPS